MPGWVRERVGNLQRGVGTVGHEASWRGVNSSRHVVLHRCVRRHLRVPRVPVRVFACSAIAVVCITVLAVARPSQWHLHCQQHHDGCGCRGCNFARTVPHRVEAPRARWFPEIVRSGAVIARGKHSSQCLPRKHCRASCGWECRYLSLRFSLLKTLQHLRAARGDGVPPRQLVITVRTHGRGERRQLAPHADISCAAGSQPRRGTSHPRRVGHRMLASLGWQRDREQDAVDHVRITSDRKPRVRCGVQHCTWVPGATALLPLAGSPLRR